MHIHSLSWLKQLLAFCWREPFPLPPRSTLFMLSIYRKSATKQYILYTFLSIYIFSFCSVPFSIFMLPCVVGLVYAPSSFVFGLVFAVGYPPSLQFPACICLHFIDAKVLLTNLAKNANLQWKLIHMRPWQ